MAPGGGQEVASIMTGMIGLLRESARLTSLEQMFETTYFGDMQHTMICNEAAAMKLLCVIVRI